MTTQTPELTRTLDARADSATANRLVAEAVATPAASAALPAPPDVPDTSVTLMVGVLDASMQPTREAVVRELNGADEEAISAPSLVRNPARYLAAIVQRGTATIGGKQPSGEELGSLLIGDRELLLIGIRRATYGDEVELVTVCPHCEKQDNDYVFDLKDVPRRELEKIEDAVFGIKVELPSGRQATIALPRATDQDAVVAAEDKNLGELNTMMLARCLKELDGRPVLSAQAEVRKMSIRDRRKLLETLTDTAPGPRLGEAKRVCNACEKEFVLGLGLLDIFRS